VAKGLNKILKSLKEGGRLKVIQVTKELVITHLLFVYDVFLFGNGTSREEGKNYRKYSSSILYCYMNKDRSLKINHNLAPD